MVKRGITLIELVLAMSLAGVLALSVGLAMSAGARFSADAEVKTALRRDARVALLTIENRLRCQKFADILVDAEGDTLTFNRTNPGAGTCYFEKNGGNLVLFQDAATRILVDGCCSGLTFAIEDGEKSGTYLVRTTLTLTQRGTSVTMESVVFLRNQ